MNKKGVHDKHIVRQVVLLFIIFAGVFLLLDPGKEPTGYTVLPEALTAACINVTENTNLTGNVTAVGTCMNITVDNILFDCQGFGIIGNGSGKGFEAIGRKNLTIQNCNIQNFTNGIYFVNANDTLIRNNSYFRQSYVAGSGFVIFDSFRNIFVNNYVEYNGSSVGGLGGGVGAAISLVRSSNNSVINNTIINHLSSILSNTRIPRGLSSRVGSGIPNNNNILEGNAIRGLFALSFNTASGFVVSNNVIVRHNKINSSLSGMSFTNANNLSAYNNTVFSEGTALGMSSTTNSFFANNTLSGNGMSQFSFAGLLSVSGSDNNGFFNNIVNAKSRALTFPFGGADSNNFINNTLRTESTWIFVLTADPCIPFPHYKCPQPPNTGNNLTNTLFEAPNGSIRIVPTVTIPTLPTPPASINVSLWNLNVSYNKAFMNSTNISFLNTSAWITLLGLPTVEGPAVDFNDNGTFEQCPGSVCTGFSQVGTTFFLNVSQFTTYSGTFFCPFTVNKTINLTQDIISIDDCFNFDVDNVILDCQGHTIMGNGAGIGINLTDRDNVTIRNCIIDGFETDLLLDDVDDSLFFNNTLLTEDNWIVINDSAGNAFGDTFFNTSNGSIKINNAVSPENSIVSTDKLNITFNASFLNDTNLTWLDTAGRVTLFGITFPSPIPIVDFTDTGVFAPCAPPQCTGVSFIGTTFGYDVASFTTYSSTNGTLPVPPPPSPPVSGGGGGGYRGFRRAVPPIEMPVNITPPTVRQPVEVPTTPTIREPPVQRPGPVKEVEVSKPKVPAPVKKVETVKQIPQEATKVVARTDNTLKWIFFGFLGIVVLTIIWISYQNSSGSDKPSKKPKKRKR